MGSPSWSASDVAMVPGGREFYHSNPLGILLERQLNAFCTSPLPECTVHIAYIQNTILWLCIPPLLDLIQGEKNMGKEIELKFDEEVLQVLSPYLISLRD